ncbi:MAG: AI-2E family transporter [Muribaculaceae bacterium]
MFSSEPYTFDRVVRLVLSLVLMVAVVYFVYVLRDVLLPFVVACLVAYIFEPFVQYNRSILRLKGRGVAVFVTLFETFTLLCLLCYLFVPTIVKEMYSLGLMLQEYATEHRDVDYVPVWLQEFIRNNVDLKSIASHITSDDVQKVMDSVFSVVSGGVSFVVGIVEWIFALLYLVFIMLDYDRLMSGFKKIVPAKYRKTVFGIGNDIKRSMNLYFRGQALIAVIVAVIYCIGFTIVGLPLAIVLGLLIGVLFMVPYLQFITIIPVTFLCLVVSTTGETSFWTMWWECMAVYAVVQVVADVILTPKIMGKAMGMNPAIILLSLSIWGSLLGILGMIIALPLTTLIIDYYNRYVSK